MRKFRTLLFTITLMSVTMIACKDTKGKENQEGGVTEKTETPSETSKNTEAEKMEMATVLNANLATEDNLKGYWTF